MNEYESRQLAEIWKLIKKKSDRQKGLALVPLTRSTSRSADLLLIQHRQLIDAQDSPKKISEAVHDLETLLEKLKGKNVVAHHVSSVSRRYSTIFCIHATDDREVEYHYAVPGLTYKH